MKVSGFGFQNSDLRLNSHFSMGALLQRVEHGDFGCKVRVV